MHEGTNRTHTLRWLRAAGVFLPTLIVAAPIMWYWLVPSMPLLKEPAQFFLNPLVVGGQLAVVITWAFLQWTPQMAREHPRRYAAGCGILLGFVSPLFWVCGCLWFLTFLGSYITK